MLLFYLNHIMEEACVSIGKIHSSNYQESKEIVTLVFGQ